MGRDGPQGSFIGVATRPQPMAKQAVRERVWDDLEDSGVARFPFPP